MWSFDEITGHLHVSRHLVRSKEQDIGVTSLNGFADAEPEVAQLEFELDGSMLVVHVHDVLVPERFSVFVDCTPEFRNTTCRILALTTTTSRIFAQHRKNGFGEEAHPNCQEAYVLFASASLGATVTHAGIY